jgi:hypothetical protein
MIARSGETRSDRVSQRKSASARSPRWGRGIRPHSIRGCAIPP